MQHLDEGTIHSWLDGALSADEAARVEAHVAECPQCAAVVAEARGFIAASSRILTALDHLPGGVVPAATSIKWYNRPAWRAAAAVLVVAVGSLVVVRNTERDSVAAPTITASTMSERITAREVPAQQPPATTAPATATETRKSKPSPSVAAADSSGKPATEANFSGGRVGISVQRNAVTPKQARDETVNATIAATAGAPPRAGGAETMTTQSALGGGVGGAVVTGASARDEARLKVVGHPRQIGAVVTLYEVAPGDTVTFTEQSNLQLEGVVVTGSATGDSRASRSTAKSAASAPPQVASPSRAAPAARVEITNGVTTIIWSDASTGSMLRLSGRMPVERLMEIKLRIERERAAAAAKKKALAAHLAGFASCDIPIE
jgi:hypothetical protein